MLNIPDHDWQVKASDPQTLTQLLGLREFQVVSAAYDAWSERLLLNCEPTWEVAVCSVCQQVSAHPHQYQRRLVRDLPLSGNRCYLEFDQRRFKCEHCRRPFSEVWEAIAPHARYTQRYGDYLFDACRDTSIQAVSQREQIGYKTVEGLFYRYAQAQDQARAFHVVERLGLDEIALRKGHDAFVLVLSELGKGMVLTVLPERTKEALEAYFDTWTPAQREAVTDVATDLWQPYRLAVEAKLPNARLNADRFHVMKNLNEQVTTTRREIQRRAPAAEKAQLKGARWLVVKNQDNLSPPEKTKLDAMLARSPTLKTLHTLKEEFRAIFETAADRTTASHALTEWISRVEAVALQPLAKFVTTLRNWWDPILNYFTDHLTSGCVEGLNNKIKLIKRRAYGYRNFEHFRLRLIVECSGAT